MRAFAWIFLLGFSSLGFSAQSNKYYCDVQGARQNGALIADGVVRFTYSTDGESSKLFDVIGYLTVNYKFNVSEPEIKNYIGVFLGAFENKKSYRGQVYKNHHKFENFDAELTSQYDGGGMFGYLTVNKNNGKGHIDAHYVFQAGDNIGGTFDLKCRKR